VAPAGVLIGELGERLIVTWSQQVGYPAILSMSVRFMTMWIQRAHAEPAAWLAGGTPDRKQLRAQYRAATEKLPGAQAELAESVKRAQQRAAVEERAVAELENARSAREAAERTARNHGYDLDFESPVQNPRVGDAPARQHREKRWERE
jgi:hypothetical protein